MHSVILCGGSGTRLWPLSRKNFPKQFLNLYSDKSLLQETFLRMRKIMPLENIFLVTNGENFFNVYNQIRDIEKNFQEKQVLVEPASLNTAPAVTYAVKYLAEEAKIDLEEPIIILPSDHYIGNGEAYAELVKKAMKEVGDNIGTIGINPLSPDTGFGYIKKGEKNAEKSYFKVLEFKEKPDKNTAERYLESGRYVWNSGMYIFNIRAFIKEIHKHAPELYSLFIQNFSIFLEKFPNLPAIPIDIAIAEKSDKVIVFEGNFVWSDIGSFDKLAEITAKDKFAGGRHIGFDSKNIFVHSTGDRLVVTLGVEDLIVVENNDSILIQRKGKSEDIKKVVEYLKENQFKELNHNIIVYRPWGKYEVLFDTSTHKVKKITVYPGAKLSLQNHYHRAEHWVVVKGVAKVVNGDKSITLKENESTFIPALTLHRLENPGKINLELIEVQTGSYLEEDDIMRYDDDYNRA